MADYRKFEEGRDQGDFSLLPELHASLSCLKVHNSTAIYHRYISRMYGGCLSRNSTCAAGVTSVTIGDTVPQAVLVVNLEGISWLLRSAIVTVVGSRSM